MGLLIIEAANIRMEVADYLLDSIKDQIEETGRTGGGFWIVGDLQREIDGEATYSDPSQGHQRLWVPNGTVVGLVYDRPLSQDPDGVEWSANEVRI